MQLSRVIWVTMSPSEGFVGRISDAGGVWAPGAVGGEPCSGAHELLDGGVPQPRVMWAPPGNMTPRGRGPCVVQEGGGGGGRCGGESWGMGGECCDRWKSQPF